jgi:hypothetical protein
MSYQMTSISHEEDFRQETCVGGQRMIRLDILYPILST